MSEIREMATALYDFATLYEHATWDGKRPGLVKPNVTFPWKSCGAFRAWAIHAHNGVVAFSMDGYAHRDRRRTGVIHVKVGPGSIVFPPSDSRSSHSLELSSSDKHTALVDVTNAMLDWQPTIQRMTNELRDTKAALVVAIDEYDKAEHEKRVADRESQLKAARQAILSAEP